VETTENGLEVRLVGRSNATDRLSRLADAGADVRLVNEAQKTSFYVADGEYLLLHANSGKSTVVFKDDFIGSVMTEEFEDMYNNGNEINNEA